MYIGKTSIVTAITNIFGHEHTTYISHDNYYKDRSHMTPEERTHINFDHPDALDTHLLVDHINALKSGQSVFIPFYDFSTHTRIPDKSIEIKPNKIILVDGILIYASSDLKNLLDVKVDH
jgi:uridine kinase